MRLSGFLGLGGLLGYIFGVQLRWPVLAAGSVFPIRKLDMGFLGFAKVLVLVLGIADHSPKLLIDSNDGIVRLVVVIIGEALVVFGSRLDLNLLLGDHAVAEGLEELEEVFEVRGFAVGDGLPRNVVEVVFDEFGDEVDDTLDLLAGAEALVLAQPEQLDYGLREDYLADLEVDLLAFQDLDLLDPAPDPHVLEDVYRDVYYR